MTLSDGLTLTAEPVGESGAQILSPTPRRCPITQKPNLRFEALGRRRARVYLHGERAELTPRHSEIVLLLMLYPDGLSSHELGRELYGPDYNPISVRAEMSRLRRVLGPVLAKSPYRVDAQISSDFAQVERLLQRGDVAAASRAYVGPLLTDSRVPTIVAVRARIAESLHSCRSSRGLV